ncbi:hypothetical protein OIO90_000646 [Microbotryomycetes sp. JL221]|nr:hypothetical protein OIO90_000646 [Microbotryomycetes sp. JL221]
MKSSLAFILAAATATVASASTAEQIERRSALASTSHTTSSTGEPHLVTRAQKHLQKRLLCGFLGILCDYSSDVNNCGRAGNVCPSNWANGGGRTCQNNVCGAGYCNGGYDFNWSTRQCQAVHSDINNCASVSQAIPTTAVQLATFVPSPSALDRARMVPASSQAA